QALEPFRDTLRDPLLPACRAVGQFRFERGALAAIDTETRRTLRIVGAEFLGKLIQEPLHRGVRIGALCARKRIRERERSAGCGNEFAAIHLHENAPRCMSARPYYPASARTSKDVTLVIRASRVGPNAIELRSARAS